MQVTMVWNALGPVHYIHILAGCCQSQTHEIYCNLATKNLIFLVKWRKMWKGHRDETMFLLPQWAQSDIIRTVMIGVCSFKWRCEELASNNVPQDSVLLIGYVWSWYLFIAQSPARKEIIVINLVLNNGVDTWNKLS